MPAKKRKAAAAAVAAPLQPPPAATPVVEDDIAEDFALPQLFSAAAAAAAAKPPPASDPPPAKRRLLDSVAPLLPASVDKRVAAAAARLFKEDEKKTAKTAREGGSAAAAPEEEEAVYGEAAAKQVRNVVELRRSPANGRLYSKFRFFAHFGGYEEWDSAEGTSSLNDVVKVAAEEEQEGAQDPDGVWHGIVKRWSPSHGFGFVTPDGGGEDVFVHVSALPEGYGLKEGKKVTLEHLRKDGKQRAIEGTVRGAGVVVCAKTQKKIDHRKNGFVGVRKSCVVVEENDPTPKKDGAKPDKKEGFCFHCKQRGHYSRNCPTGGGEKGDIARKMSGQRKKEAIVTNKLKPGGKGGKGGKGSKGGKGGKKGGSKGAEKGGGANIGGGHRKDDGEDEIR